MEKNLIKVSLWNRTSYPLKRLTLAFDDNNFFVKASKSWYQPDKGSLICDIPPNSEIEISFCRVSSPYPVNRVYAQPAK